MNLKIIKHPDMEQAEVCATLRKIDRHFHAALTTILQQSNFVEEEIAGITKRHLLGRKSKALMYYGDLSKHALTLFKLTACKDPKKMLSCIKTTEITRDVLACIIYKFLKEHSAFTGREAVQQHLNAYYELRNEIVKAYLKLGLSISCKLTRRPEDSFQNSVIGIINAIDKARVPFLEAGVFSFANFVKFHVRNAITNAGFNIRTDFVFDMSTQEVKLLYAEDDDAFRKAVGERFIDEMSGDENECTYLPDYLQEDQPESLLTSQELTILALLHADPSECAFSTEPLREELLAEIERQHRKE